MKAKEMIEQLQEIVDKHGDMDVCIDTAYNFGNAEKIAYAEIDVGDIHFRQIRLYDETGWKIR